MKERNRRFTAALCGTLAIHIAAAALLGIFGLHFYRHPPGEVIEVDVNSGGGGGGGGGGNPAPAEEKKSGVLSSMTQGLSDIVEKVEEKTEETVQKTEEKVETKTEPRVTEPQETPAAEPSHESNDENNKEPVSNANGGEGTGSGGGEGSGEGTGKGSGEGSGEGSGSGSGSGDGNGSGTGSGEGPGSGRGAPGPVTPPRILSKVDPVYPFSAQTADASGVVRVTIHLDAGGNVTRASIASSSGRGDMDQAALSAVYNWSFSPALDGYGQPAPSRITIPVTFRMK